MKQMSVDQRRALVARLPRLRLFDTDRRDKGYWVVLRFPDHAESRMVKRIPTTGMSIRDEWGRRWLVDETLRSGHATYTVSCVERGLYRRTMVQGRDLAADLLELARRPIDTAAEQLRRWQHRNYIP